jgi:hypothetical protein
MHVQKSVDINIRAFDSDDSLGDAMIFPGHLPSLGQERGPDGRGGVGDAHTFLPRWMVHANSARNSTLIRATAEKHYRDEGRDQAHDREALHCHKGCTCRTTRQRGGPGAGRTVAETGPYGLTRGDWPHAPSWLMKCILRAGCDG